jgi:anti-sigma regulatory factor (Ser/Thr protein kinase)
MNAIPRPANCRISRICLPADPTAAGLAREFVRKVLPQWGLDDLGDDAELVVSELVTNAVRVTEAAAAEPIRGELQAGHVTGVQLRFTGSSLYTEVWDRGDGTPGIPDQAPDAESGRGLFLVAFLSARWSSRPSAAGGKVTWAELQRPNAAPEAVHPELPLCDTSNHSQEPDEEVVQLMDAAFALSVLEERGQPDPGPASQDAARQAPRRRARQRRVSQEPAAMAQTRKDAGTSPSNLQRIAAVLHCLTTALRRRPSDRMHQT